MKFVCAILGMLMAVSAAVAQEEKVRPPAVGDPVVYKKVGDRELKLFVSKPADWKATDTRPAIVLFHGGGWNRGAPGMLNPQAQYFASRGMVAILVEYRLSATKNEPPINPCQDAKSAMRYVRSHAKELGIDPDRIAAGGGSAGGHLAAFVSMIDGQDDPKDDPAFSPKANALVLFNPALNNGPGMGSNDRMGERYKEFSPAHNIRSDAPPTIILIGTEDIAMPMKVVEAYRDEMKKAGARCEVVFYESQPHGFFNKSPWTEKTLADADKFLVSLKWLRD